MDHLIQDIRYGFRTLARQPSFAATAILALALGIGANTAVFSVVYAVLLKPLPFAKPEQLIYVHDTFPAVPLASISWPKFVALRDGNRTLTALAAIAPGNVTITGDAEPQQIAAFNVSGDFFTVFGVGPQYGRLINRDDDVPNGGKVIALSYGLWQRRFGADPNVIGQAVTVDGQAFTVVSVMPASFTYPTGAEAWIPLALPAKFQGNNFLRLLGRMKPGVTLSQATDDLEAITAAYNQANNLERDVKAYGLQDYLTSRNRQMLLVLQGTVAFVLLIACANVANLLLARSVSRGRELSIRAAIGAGRVRLVRQLLTESVLLALLGSIVGVLLAGWLLRLFLTLAPNLGGVQTIRIDRQVLIATLLTAFVTGVLFGLAPARYGFNVDPNESLRDSGARGATSAAGKGAGRTLVIAEIALAMVLVVGAGLMVKSLLKLQAQETGFRPDGVLTFQLNLPQTGYPTNENVVQTYQRILEHLRAVPGVQAAGAANMIPLVNFGLNGGFGIAGRPPFLPVDRAPVLEYRVVTPGYFTAMGIPILRGRDISESDRAAGTPVCVINATMAAQFWPNGNPIGERLTFGPGAPSSSVEIVGVVGDVRSNTLSRAAVIEAYAPLTQVPGRGMGILVRSEMADPTVLLPAIRQRIASIDPNLPIVKPQTMNAIVDAAAGGTRLSSMLTAVFALLAALLASVGIYSLIAYSVAERTRELGIRIALGADRRAVVRLILGEGLVMAAIGIAIGLAGAWMLTGTLETMLYGVSPLDPQVLAATAATVVLVTALASYIPARRALRVDPMTALRAA